MKIHHPLVLLTALMLLLNVNRCSPAVDDQKLYQQARSALTQGDFDTCIALAQQISNAYAPREKVTELLAEATSGKEDLQVANWLEEATLALDRGVYASVFKIIDRIPEGHASYPEGQRLVEIAKTRQWKAQWREKYEQALALFGKGQYRAAKDLLAGFPEDHPNAGDAALLSRNLASFFEIQEKLTLSPVVQKQSVLIDDPANIPVNRGIIASIDLENHALLLHNATDHRVKPDLWIFILNKDGVILLEHRESWLFKSLDYQEDHKVTFGEKLHFPARPLVFSRWAQWGWDMTPRFALCLGSKTGLSQIKEALQKEMEVIQHQPLRLEEPFDLTEQLPGTLPFTTQAMLETTRSDIVEGLVFSEGEVRIHYRNKTEMRVKPRIQGIIFNRDGVILETFEDSWRISSLEPGETDEVTRSISYSMPEKLAFSRWAKALYDLEPAFVYLAGSGKAFDQLVEEAETKVQNLYATAGLVAPEDL